MGQQKQPEFVIHRNADMYSVKRSAIGQQQQRCNSKTTTAAGTSNACKLLRALLLWQLAISASSSPMPAENSVEAMELTTTTDTTSSETVEDADVNNGSTSLTPYKRAWRLITRAEWQARAPTHLTNFSGQIPYVILHHSYQPGVCLTSAECEAAMRSMQNFHMDGHGWPDIGYSFAIGGDGNVYEARGYNVVGAHAPNYNSRSLGLLLIGDFVDNLPPAPMMDVAKDFIKYSVEIGKLRTDYVLHGHRQVRETECPGAALYAEIQTWENWKAKATDFYKPDKQST